MGVSVREKPKDSGYWWLFIRHQGERVCQYVSQDKETAEDAAKDVRRDIRTGKFDLEALKASRAPKKKEAPAAPAPVIPTLRDYFARFEREHLKLAVRASTANLYAYVFSLHILPALVRENPELEDSPTRQLGDFRLNEISRSHLKLFVASLMAKKRSRVVKETVKAADGTVTTKKKTIHFTLSRPSLGIILSALTTCLTNAQREDGLIPTNPALSLGKFIKQAKRRHESIDPFEPHEVPVFLEAVLKFAPGFLTMFIVLLHTGIRSGECGGLQWSDVDFRNRYMLIQRTRTPKGKLEPPKNGRIRKVDLSDAAISALRSHRAELQKKYFEKGDPMPDWVFPNQDGTPYNMTNVRNRVFYKVCEKAGFASVSVEYRLLKRFLEFRPSSIWGGRIANAGINHTVIRGFRRLHVRSIGLMVAFSLPRARELGTATRPSVDFSGATQSAGRSWNTNSRKPPANR